MRRIKAAYYALRGHGVIIGVMFDSEDPVHEGIILGPACKGKRLLIADNKAAPMRRFYWKRYGGTTNIIDGPPLG